MGSGGVNREHLIDRLLEELDREKKRAAESGALASLHYAARIRAEADAKDAAMHGVKQAIRWVRAMPRTRLVEGHIHVGEEIVRMVCGTIARHLERRLEESDSTTAPGT